MSHYFESPDSEMHPRTITARIWERDYQFTTANGVFSGSRLDLGTAVLFRESTPPPSSATRLLDLGCGYGPIAVALAVECPGAQVDAIDVNERALSLTTLNAEAAGVADRVHAASPQQVDPKASYDEIWSNPPIRIGKAALHELLTTWLPRLRPDGIAWLVVARNLGGDSLQQWLTEQGWSTERVGSAKGFRVLRLNAHADS